MKIYGHETIRKRLARAAAGGPIAQSYLFSGPEGIGKKLVAEEFACVLAGDPEFEPSAQVPFPPDVRLLAPEVRETAGKVRTADIGAEEIRNGLRFLSQTPLRARRVLLVDDAHRLSPAAQNILLKFAEEPSPQTALILITSESGALLETLRSRLIVTHFSFLPPETMRAVFPSAVLAEAGIPEFFLTLGRPGLVIEALSDPESFSRSKDALSRLFRLSTLTLAERLSFAEELAGDTSRAARVLEWFLPGMHARLAAERDPKRLQRLTAFLDLLSQTRNELQYARANPRLVLERLLLSL